VGKRERGLGPGKKIRKNKKLGGERKEKDLAERLNYKDG
jgi:hypothetical protein